jgi:TetR/AcrR family transcriptional regulator, lmrAB and yxaGH operons repressor
MIAERSDTLPTLAEVFREHSYEGASLSLLSQATGLGKGSLYHFFPGGKEEMASAALGEADAWFEREVFTPPRDASRPADGMGTMLDAVDGYFGSGRRVCLVGAPALGDARDRFAQAPRSYFSRWVEALAGALVRDGHSAAAAGAMAEEVVLGIQGAIVLARALDDPGVFTRAIERMRSRCVGWPADQAGFKARPGVGLER